jgi:hypothetical protein
MKHRIVRVVEGAVGVAILGSLAAACNGDPVAPEPGTLVRTSANAYDVPSTIPTYTVTFTLTNTLSEPVYYSPHGPIIEKLVAGQWIFGYSFGPTPQVLLPPIELAPGETRDLAVTLAVKPSSSIDTGFLHGIEGTYRGNYGFKLGPIKNDWPDGSGFVASSNEFEIRLTAAQ